MLKLNKKISNSFQAKWSKNFEIKLNQYWFNCKSNFVDENKLVKLLFLVYLTQDKEMRGIFLKNCYNFDEEIANKYIKYIEYYKPFQQFNYFNDLIENKLNNLKYKQLKKYL